MKKRIAFSFLFIFSFLLHHQGFTEIIMPSIISDHMVVQQSTEINIWGWTTEPTENIKVWGSWDDSNIVETKASRGKWNIKLSTPKSKGPFSIFISGHEVIEIKDVLCGEVWLGSGQSNMQMCLDSLRPNQSGILNREQEIAEANYPQIRLFHVPRIISQYPQDDCKGKWVVCTPENVKLFSAVLYFFGREIHKELKEPVGLIHSSWGGTNIKVWIDERDTINTPNFWGLKQEGKPVAGRPDYTGEAYNAMINPIVPFNIAGAIWYQGESNRWEPHTYEALQKHLITTWRKKWKTEFPFYYTQIAPFNYKNGINTGFLREAQLNAMNFPKTGMIVTNDLVDDINDIHPKDKKSVGERLSRWALAKTYGVKGIYYSGPIYESMKIEGDKIRLTFKYSEPGLIKHGSKLTQFKIAAEDQVFVDAKARIDDDEIIVWSEKIKNPVAVRFAFDHNAVHNLFNKAGLPASPFRTDKWEE